MAKEAQAYPKGKKPGKKTMDSVTSDDATFMKRGGKVPSGKVPPKKAMGKGVDKGGKFGKGK